MYIILYLYIYDIIYHCNGFKMVPKEKFFEVKGWKNPISLADSALSSPLSRKIEIQIAFKTENKRWLRSKQREFQDPFYLINTKLHSRPHHRPQRPNKSSKIFVMASRPKGRLLQLQANRGFFLTFLGHLRPPYINLKCHLYFYFP